METIHQSRVRYSEGDSYRGYGSMALDSLSTTDWRAQIFSHAISEQYLCTEVKSLGEKAAVKVDELEGSGG